MTDSPEVIWRMFFRLAFPQTVSGWVRICTMELYRRDMHNHWYNMPGDLEKLLADVEQFAQTNREVYFTPQYFKSPEAHKENISSCPSLWADLDECRPEHLEEKPTFIWETSPGRFQALWITEEDLGPDAIELSKRIAYKYKDLGCDTSGWIATKLLRVPQTTNRKYINTDTGPVTVTLLNEGHGGLYRREEVDTWHLPEVLLTDFAELPYPTHLPQLDAAGLMDKYHLLLRGRTRELYETQPVGDWSGALFAFMMGCFEGGMEKEEVLVVAMAAACNKFARDGKGNDVLWADVCRAYGTHMRNLNGIIIEEEASDLDLLTAEEYGRIKDVKTFVEDYIDWASGLGDAATQYHQGGAFIILSAIFCGSVVLPTSFGTLKPNLWFMILGDTTLTRKSTAMDIAMDLLIEVDSDVVLATDGSIEGLMSALEARPGRASIFLRDEFSGLLEQMTKKDYMAGMAETFTKLYDGKLTKRLLKKEKIEVKDPCVIIFAGGIKTRVQQLFGYEHVSSGFVPRFVFLTAKSDVTKVKPLGPPTLLDTSERSALRERITEMYNHYHEQEMYQLPNGTNIPRDKRWDARLTDEAWVRYNEFEHALLKSGLDTDRPDLMTPLCDRLAKSALKASILIAASRRLEESVTVTLDDLLIAIKHAQDWRKYAIEIIKGIGRSTAESQLDNVYGNIQRNPGISRGALMRHYHLTAREADAIFTTLEQRGLITTGRSGRGYTYHAI